MFRHLEISACCSRNYFPKQLQMAGFLMPLTSYTTRLCFETMLLFTTKHKTQIPPLFLQVANSHESISHFVLGYNITGSWGKTWGSFNGHAPSHDPPTSHSNNNPNFSHDFLSIYSSTIITYAFFSALSKASHGGVRSSCSGDQRQKLHGQTKRAAGHGVMWDWRWDSVFYGSLADTRQGSNRYCRLLSGSGSSQGQPRGNRSVGCKGRHGRCSKGRLHPLTNRLYKRPPLHTVPLLD